MAIFDASNLDKRAVIIRNTAALCFGLLVMAGFVWASYIELPKILWRYPEWTAIGGFLFLILFPLVTYIGVLAIFGANMGFGGWMLGMVVMLVLFFARAITYGYFHRGVKGKGGADPFYEGLIGGSPSKKTGFWSLPIQMGSSSTRGSSPKGGGRFGGGGATGRY